MTPPDRAARIEALLDALELATAPLPYPLDAVLGALATDKKHAGGGLRWVLPTADGYEVRSDVPVELVERVAAGLLAPAGAGAAAGRRRDPRPRPPGPEPEPARDARAGDLRPRHARRHPRRDRRPGRRSSASRSTSSSRTTRAR